MDLRHSLSAEFCIARILVEKSRTERAVARENASTGRDTFCSQTRSVVVRGSLRLERRSSSVEQTCTSTCIYSHNCKKVRKW